MLDVELKLLLIEDDAEDKDIFEYMLSKIDGLKYQVKWCDTFSAGQSEILNNHYDVIFMDYSLVRVMVLVFYAMQKKMIAEHQLYFCLLKKAVKYTKRLNNGAL